MADKKKRHFIPIFLLCSLFLINACSSIDCPLNNSVYTTYNLQKASGIADTLKDTLSVISLQTTTEQDPVLLNKLNNFSSFTLPISYSNEEDVLFFIYTGTTTISDTLYAGTDSATVTATKTSYALGDTVVITKTNRKHFESVDCTPSFFHTITGLNYTRNGIDSITINNPEVTYDTSKEQFHIYFKHIN